MGLKEKLSFGRWHGQVGLYGGLMRVLINEFLIVEKFREKLVRRSLQKRNFHLVVDKARWDCMGVLMGFFSWKRQF
jgi:hypothetical protein